MMNRLRIPLLILWFALTAAQPVQAGLVELRTGPAAAMAVHAETDGSRWSLFAGAGLALPGFTGSPLRHPSVAFGIRWYTQPGTNLRPYITGQYGWVLRSKGLEPFAGGGVGLAWYFGPNKAYRLTLESDLLLRNSWLPYPSAGFGLAVRW